MYTLSPIISNSIFILLFNCRHTIFILLLYTSVTTVECNFIKEFLKLLKSTRLHTIDIIYNYFYLYNNNCIYKSLNQINFIFKDTV